LVTSAITPALLREAEAIAYLGVGRTTLWSLIWAGEIKRVHVGRAMRIPRAELDRYIQERCEAAGIDSISDGPAAA